MLWLPVTVSGETESEASGPLSYTPPEGQYTSVEELKDKRLGVLTGSSHENVAKKEFPGAELLYYNTTTDMVEGLNSGKIDAFLYDEPALIYMMRETDGITYIPEALASYDFADAFPKTDAGSKLRDQMSEYIRKIKSDGTLNQIMKTWLFGDEKDWTLADYENFPATNGTLTMVTDATAPPFTMVYEDGITGVEADIAVRFCEEYGYGLSISNVSMTSLLTAIQSGKADFAGSGLSVTEERAQSVDFSEPYCASDVVLVVLQSDKAVEGENQAEGTGIWDRIRSSFEKTFLRENRWKTFVDGLLTTLTITLCAIAGGTLLGFGVFMLCRNGNRAANGITRVCMWLVQGMPTVVLLMVFYYIIFGRSPLSGEVISVLCFILIFAATVFGLMKVGVGTVDPGQYEAAYRDCPDACDGSGNHSAGRTDQCA